MCALIDLETRLKTLQEVEELKRICYSEAERTQELRKDDFSLTVLLG